MVVKEMTNRDIGPLAQRIAESAECDYITVLHEIQDWFYRGESHEQSKTTTEG